MNTTIPIDRSQLDKRLEVAEKELTEGKCITMKSEENVSCCLLQDKRRQ